MRRMIHRSNQAIASSSSDDDDEEDAFSALSKKKKKILNKNNNNSGNDVGDSSTTATTAAAVAAAVAATTDTSSNKRHFHMSSERAAKMDALLKELEYDASIENAVTGTATITTTTNPQYTDGFVPNKKGSFVEAGEEYSTTNVFVGNLDPSVTEEMLTDLFRQFGEEYKDNMHTKCILLH
jgi:hypothetical protein